MNMDMRISGRGSIPSGEYENISISGSGRLYQKVRCVSFCASGSTKGDSIECAENFRISGSTSFDENIKAKQIRVSGSLSCEGDLIADETFSCSGSAKCKKSIKCEQLSVSGSLNVGCDIVAENVKVAGAVNCEGLLNAENIEIKADTVMNIGSIGGSNILIKRKGFSICEKKRVIVTSSIEGDNIALDSVSCPRVTGRVVSIGKDCKIDLVQYSEEINISPKAKVGKTEKI